VAGHQVGRRCRIRKGLAVHVEGAGKQPLRAAQNDPLESVSFVAWRAAMQRFRPPADAREFTVSAALRSPSCRKHLDIDGRFQGTADVARRRRRAIQPCGVSSMNCDPTSPIEGPFLTSSKSHTRPEAAVRAGQVHRSVFGLDLSSRQASRDSSADRGNLIGTEPPALNFHVLLRFCVLTSMLRRFLCRILGLPACVADERARKISLFVAGACDCSKNAKLSPTTERSSVGKLYKWTPPLCKMLRR